MQSTGRKMRLLLNPNNLVVCVSQSAAGYQKRYALKSYGEVLVKIGEFILESIKLLIPKFYNKITWAVVIGGLGLTSTSIFEKVLSAVLEKSIDIKITDGNDGIIGIVLVVIGLGYHLIAQKINSPKPDEQQIEKAKKKEAHDTNLFQSYNDKLTQNQLNRYLESLEGDHSYRSSLVHPIYDFFQFTETEDTNFLNSKLNEAVADLRGKLDKVTDFAALNFFVYPENQTGKDFRYCLHPDFNPDRGLVYDNEKMKYYDDKAQELMKHTDLARKSFIEFRNSVKQELLV